MATFDDLFSQNPALQCSDDVRALVSKVTGLEDIQHDERDAFQAGYIAGLSFATSSLTEGKNVSDVAVELLLRMQEWGAA